MIPQGLLRRILALLTAVSLLGGLSAIAPATVSVARRARQPLRASCCCGTGACKMASCPGSEAAVSVPQSGCSLSACQPDVPLPPLLAPSALWSPVLSSSRVDSASPLAFPGVPNPALAQESPAPLLPPPRT